MIDGPVPRYPAHFVLKLIAKTEFRNFTPNEWMGWQGCESANPQYGEFKAEDPFTGKRVEGVLILDGTQVELNVNDYCGEPALYEFKLLQ